MGKIPLSGIATPYVYAVFVKAEVLKGLISFEMWPTPAANGKHDVYILGAAC